MSAAHFIAARTAASCIHCGTPTQGEEFCCSGCEAVYRVIGRLGLSEFYSRKAEGVCFKPAKPASSSAKQYASWDVWLLEQDVRRFTVFATGVHCSACLWLIERLPQVAPEIITDARLDLARSIIDIELAPDARASQVGALLDSLGYPSELIVDPGGGEEKLRRENRRQLVDLGIAGALAGNVMLLSIPMYAGLQGTNARLFEWLSGALAIPSFFYCGRSFFRSTGAFLRRGVFSVDVPIFIAMLVAFMLSAVSLIRGRPDLYFDSLTALIFLLLASRYLLARLRQEGLVQSNRLYAKTGAAPYLIGERFEPTLGSELDCDGILRSGSGWFSRSFLTGESAPTLLRAGDAVRAGFFFQGSGGSDRVEIEVTATGANTLIARMIEQIRCMDAQRSRLDHLYERWAKALLMAVTAVALATVGFFWTNGQAWSGIERALALLIVTCPCGFALGVPLLTTLLSRQAVSRGLVIRDVDFLEKIGTINHVCLDKTGTLTRGAPEWVSGRCPARLQPVLSAMAARSCHPFSRAIVAKLAPQTTIVLESFEEKPGIGLSAKFDSKIYALERHSGTAEALSFVVFLEDGREIALLGFQDALQSDARTTVTDLLDRGIGVSVLSGDNRSAVAEVGKSVGLSAECMRSRMLPEDKASAVRALQATGAKVLMVGDGVNDALAMKTADVSLAVYGGLETALKTASAYSTRPGCRSVIESLKLSDEMKRVLRGSFVFSALYNAVSCGFAVSGNMSPLLAAVLMPLSALTVFTYIAFSLRSKA